jgi:hypothetical protein
MMTVCRQSLRDTEVESVNGLETRDVLDRLEDDIGRRRLLQHGGEHPVDHGVIEHRVASVRDDACI